MILLDVNVLVYAHREDTINHALYRPWLKTIVNGEERMFFFDGSKYNLQII